MYPRDTVTSQQKRAGDASLSLPSHAAQADIVLLQIEERARPTAGQPFKAEQDIGTGPGKNIVLPIPSAWEERYRTL